MNRRATLRAPLAVRTGGGGGGWRWVRSGWGGVVRGAKRWHMEREEKGKGMAGVGNRVSRRDVTSSKTSASLLRTSSGSDWKEGTLEGGGGEVGVRAR